MIRHVVFAAILAGSAALAWHPAQAQGLEPGAMAGKSYLPSTHTKGCSGLLCDSDDPHRIAYTAGGGAPAVSPPPCAGLLCSLTPYSMAPPVTAATARQAELAAPQAAPAPAAVEPVKKKRSAHRKKTKTVAARTPDPASAQAAKPQ